MAEVASTSKAANVVEKAKPTESAPKREKTAETASPSDTSGQNESKSSSDQGLASTGNTGWWGSLMGMTKSDGEKPNKDGDGKNDGGWLGGVGKAWEEAGEVMKGVGDKLMATVESVDLEEKSRKLREEGAKLVGEVTEGMKKVELKEMLDGEKLRGEAERLGREGRMWWGKAGEAVGNKTREMREILLDDGNKDKVARSKVEGEKECTAPWDENILPEKERAYATKLREEMGRIVVDAIYSKKKRGDLFLNGTSLRAGYKFDFEGNAGMAKGALESDGNLRRLRAGLVPRKIKEEEFWDAYFYHVDRLRRELVANNGELVEATGEDEVDPLFAEDDEEEEEVLAPLGAPGPRPKLQPLPQKGDSNSDAGVEGKAQSKPEIEDDSSTLGGKRDWDEEIDKIFDDE